MAVGVAVGVDVGVGVGSLVVLFRAREGGGEGLRDVNRNKS